MNLIRVGNRIVNLDRVAKVVMSDRTVRLCGDDSSEYASFSGVEAEALRWYLEHEALDLLAHHTTAVAEQARQKATHAACAAGDHYWVCSDVGNYRYCGRCGTNKLSFEREQASHAAVTR